MKLGMKKKIASAAGSAAEDVLKADARPASARKGMVMDPDRWLQAGVGMALVLFGAGVAMAGNGFGAMAMNGETNLSDFGGLISSAFYLGGFGLTGWGLHTTRKAIKSEGQGREKVSHGLTEMLVGGALIAVPTFAGHTVNTMFNNATTSSQNATSAQVTTN